MKSKRNIHLTLFFLIPILITSCKSKISTIDNILWIPPESSLEIAKDSSELKIVQSKFFYIGNFENQILRTPGPSEIVIRCTCGETSIDCGPILRWDQSFYCFNKNECKNCRFTAFEGNLGFISGGYINPLAGICFATSNDQMPYAIDVLFKYPEYKSIIDNFLMEYYSTIDAIPNAEIKGNKSHAPSGYEFVVINTLGRALITLLPIGLSPENAIKGNIIECHLKNQKNTDNTCMIFNEPCYFYNAKSNGEFKQCIITIKKGDSTATNKGISYFTYNL